LGKFESVSNISESNLNSRRPALCCSGPPVSQCRRPALWSWPTGQPPFPLPCSAGHETWPRHAARAVPRRSGPHPPSLPVRSSTQRRTPGPSPRPCLTRLRFKRANIVPHPLFFPLALLRARPSELPLVHVGNRATAALLGAFSIVATVPPTVRPTYLPPFPDLEPPSPPSSSLAAPGASRSRRGPCLR
jgi:hypothetical protein